MRQKKQQSSMGCLQQRLRGAAVLCWGVSLGLLGAVARAQAAEPEGGLTYERGKMSMLEEQAGLTHDHAVRLLLQHPGLDRPMVNLLITRIKMRALSEGRTYTDEEFMSKFALYASEMVGWRSDLPAG